MAVVRVYETWTVHTASVHHGSVAPAITVPQFGGDETRNGKMVRAVQRRGSRPGLPPSRHGPCCATAVHARGDVSLCSEMSLLSAQIYIGFRLNR